MNDKQIMYRNSVPSNCDNEWCFGMKGTIPTTGMRGIEAQCSDLKTMENIRLKDGGVTGRGVTPCPFGFVTSNNNSGKKMNVGKISTNELTQNIFFHPEKNLPTFVPTLGNPRALFRIGNDWRWS